MNDKFRLKHKIVCGLIQLNSYIGSDIEKKTKDVEFWKQGLEENGDVTICNIDPDLTYGAMYSKVVKRVEDLKKELEENNRLIEMFKEMKEVI